MDDESENTVSSSDSDDVSEYFPESISPSGLTPSLLSNSDASSDDDLFVINPAFHLSPVMNSAGRLLSEVADIETIESSDDESDYLTQATDSADNTVPDHTKDQNTMPAAEAPTTTLDQSADDDGETCTICFSQYTNAGAHRLVALKCGHLFGQSCIERWIRSGAAKCPQCNRPARKPDIRCIFATKLKVVDTAELEKLSRDLDEERRRSQTLSVDLAVLRQKYDMLQTEFNILSARSSSMLGSPRRSRAPSHAYGAGNTLDNGELRLQAFISCNTNTCRNLAYSHAHDTIVVTFAQQNNLFKGYGIKKLTTLDMRPTEFVLIHKSEIRDVAFHESDALVLTVSNDCTAKLTSIVNNTVVHSYALEGNVPAWSCVWSRERTANFYVGLRNGKMMEFDIRNTSRHVGIFGGSVSTQPVVAMQDVPLPTSPIEERLSRGVAVSQLGSCSYLERSLDGEYKPHPIATEGNCISLSYWWPTRHLLATCRPSINRSCVMHYLYEMAVEKETEESDAENRVEFRVQRQFRGGPSAALLSRSILTENPTKSSDLWACTPDEKSKTVHIWSAASSTVAHRISTPDPDTNPVLDLCAVQSGSFWNLATLTQSGIGIHKLYASC